MRRMRVIGSALGLLVVGSACATTTGGTGASLESARPQVTRLSRAQQIAWRDSTYAPAIADMEGPGASIRAEFSNVAGSRRVRAVFDLEADAYVVVGHIDAEGVLRVVFPVDPAHDDGFVKGSKTYRSTEFFAGFTDSYRFRAQQGLYRSAGLSRYDSYDGGAGYLFVIASWRPMRFDRFATENQWDTFELAEERYLTDPRPAIYELASLLVGENREAYTVKLAKYTNTTTLYGMNSVYGQSGYGMRYCAGYQPLGFAFDPFSSGLAFNTPVAYNSYGAGYAFVRRGVTYYYDSFGDCFTTGYPGFRSPYSGYGYRIAGAPGFYNPNNPTPKRGFDPEGPRAPFAPRVAVAHSAPTARGADVPEASPAYRQRGLITSSDEPGIPERRGRTVEGRSVASAPARPSIQEMVARRAVTSDEGRASNGYSRAQGYQRSGNSSPSNYSPGSDRRAIAPRDYDTRMPTSTSQGYDRGFTPSSSGAPAGASSASPTSSSSAPPASSSAPPASSSAGSSGRPGTPQ